MASPLTATLFFRLQPYRFIPKAMMFSNTAMTVDRAAKDRKMKNSIPQNRPPGIWTNRLGMVRKIREGPASGWMPKAKQAGMMMNPAIRPQKCPGR